jgi:hypothetical protein
MRDRRLDYRPKRKVVPGSERCELGVNMLRKRLSPEQIAGKLRRMNRPNLRDAYVCCGRLLQRQFNNRVALSPCIRFLVNL